MVDYITTASLRAQAGPINEQASVVRKAEQRSPAGSTFLSHSTRDAELLPAVIRLLERHGAQVYVDKKDESLPPYTSRGTAQILRERIQQSRKFILFTTVNSKGSRWVPWELGVADGYRTLERALLAARDAHADVAQSRRLGGGGAALRVGEVRVARVDEDVAWIEQRRQLRYQVVDGPSRRDREDHRTRGAERRD